MREDVLKDKSLSDIERKILTAKANSVIIFNNQYKVFFDEKRIHFTQESPGDFNSKDNNTIYSLSEDVYVKDMNSGVSYQICQLRFIPCINENQFVLTILSDRTLIQVNIDSNSAVFVK